MTSKQIISTYDKNARRYCDATFNLVMQYPLSQFSGYLKGKKILDAGCGCGRDVAYFKEEGYDVVGIDASKGMLKEARRRVKATFKAMDFTALKFRADSFNGVWACASLVHTPLKEIPVVLKQFHKVLKKNGILYISMKEGEGPADITSKKLIRKGIRMIRNKKEYLGFKFHPFFGLFL